MLSFYKKYLAIIVLICLCMAPGSVSGYSTQITLDGKDDAGIKPEQTAFARFKTIYNDGSFNYSAVDPIKMGGQWLAGQQVLDYYARNLSYDNVKSWVLQSAGNINSLSEDFTVGDSLTGLSAGTYRISPGNESNLAYMYDFNWGKSDYEEHYWWKVYIEADQVYVNGVLKAAQGYILGKDGVSLLDLTTLDTSDKAYDSYALGSSLIDYNKDAFPSAQSAFDAVKNLYIDIPIADGGALSFWIWDWNSIDNSGSISLNVASVPEPSPFVLLAIGFTCLILVRKIRYIAPFHS